jgi:serine/threonine protein kinase/WD40 repeat protein
MNEPSLDRIPFEEIAEEFAEQVRRGEHPSIPEWIKRYPELADDIRELFPMLAMVEQFKPETHESAATADHNGPSPSGHPQQLGDYRILRYLGEGGMGVVYEAVRESLSNHVALKVMHPQFRNREKYLRLFRTEARSAARLHHTNIVSVFDYGVHDGTYYYAMQYIAGQSLDKILEDVRRLRAEKEKASSGPAPTMPWEPRDISALARQEFGGASPAGDPVRQAVTVGFLTGAYEGDARIPGTGSSADAAPPLTPSLAEDNSCNAASCSSRLADLPVGRIANPSHGDKAANTASPLSQFADLPLGQIGIGDTCCGNEAVNPALQSSELPVRRLGRIGDPSYGGKRNHHAERDDDKEDHHAERDDYYRASSSTSALAAKTEDRYHREVARLGAQIADGLAYAHKLGVIHRDIKASNLILDPMGNIWITDFGLAKFDDGEDASQSRDAAGTLRYMAPERFRGLSDARCDVYALGATLYEMLTLRPAFEASNPLELIHQIENDSPVPPRQIDGRISRDLETIVLKSLAKDPKDRFAAADELTGELRRFLENRPIRSRPISAYERLWRWCKRNPGLAAANIIAAVLTTVLAIVSTVAAWTYREQRNRIDHNLTRITASEAGLRRARTETREELFKALLDRARAERFSHRMGQRFDSLNALEQAARIGRELKLPPEKFESLRDEAIASLALPDLKAVGRDITAPPNVLAFAFDSTLTRYALRFRDGTISVRRFAGDQKIAHFQARADREFHVFCFSPDGRYLATTPSPGAALTVWDVDRKAVAVNDPGPVHGNVARFSPDSRRIALVNGKSRELIVYDLATGQASRRWPVPSPGDLAFRPDGTQIAVIANESKSPACRILDEKTGRLVQTIPLRVPANRVAWSHDGTMLATTSDSPDSKIDLWDTKTGIRRATLEGHDNSGLHAAFHPAGTLLASNGHETRLRLWDPIQGRPLFSLSGGTYLEFSPDGRIVHQVADQLTTYQVEPALEYRTLAHAAREPMDYARPSIRHDGRILAVGSNKGAVLWDLARGVELAYLPIGNAWHLMFQPSGDLITSGDIGVQRWPVHLDRDRGEFRIGPPIASPPCRCPTAGSTRTDRAGSWPWPRIATRTSRPRRGRSAWGR